MSGVLQMVTTRAEAEPALRELLQVVQRAKARVEAEPLRDGRPAHVACAQAVLEMAIEWRMPDVERWAVAWLVAAGGVHFRLRWSSRARDGRIARTARAAGTVTAFAGDGRRVVLGTATGAVQEWTPSGLRMLRGGGDAADRVASVAVRSRPVDEHDPWWAAGAAQGRLWVDVRPAAVPFPT